MSLKSLMDYTYISKYARYNKDKKRRETWSEAVDRVKEMHLRKYPQAKEEIDWAFKQVHDKRVLGSQRALQFGGAPIEKVNARIYNCISSYCDRVRFFQEAFYLLLCGCGTGFSVQKHHVAKLPELCKPTEGELVFQIPDSIEGWADALGHLISSYLDPESEYYHFRVEFDYSLIRKKGLPISSGSGKAPGPDPLARALENIRRLLDRCIKSGYKNLRPIDAYDIVMYSADAVLSGGVRRSATIALFSPDDMEMAKAKTGNWFYENPQRARSNNSALLVRNKTTREQFKTLMNCLKEFGEPGFAWTDSEECLFNPCVVGDTIVVTEDGLQFAEKLVGDGFTALVDGNKTTTEKGFWKTGHKEVLRLDFASGRRLTVTPDHKILTVDGWKKACDLQPTDEVIINNHRNFKPDINEDSQDFAQGYLLGYFLGNGNVCNELAQLKWWGENKSHYRKDALSLLKQAEWHSVHHKEESSSKAVYSCIDSKAVYNFAEEKGCLTDGKQLSKLATTGNWSYLAGLVAGYFDADGTVAHNPDKGSSLRIWSVQFENLRNLQVILNAFGIYSKIYNERLPAGFRQLPDGKGGVKKYYCQTAHELVISNDSIIRFFDVISPRNKIKKQKIESIASGYKRMPNRTHFTDKVLALTLEGYRDVYDCTVPDVHAFDANGVYVHNCVEISLYGYDEFGNSGWEACNLCEINGSMLETVEDFEIAARAGAIIGTLQAGYTDFGYLGEATRRIVEREALLGVSITGIMEHPNITFDQDLQRRMAELIKEVNAEFAKKIGINPAARCTCVKPAGCQKESTLLVTKNGILTFKEVGNTEGDTWQDHNIEILSEKEYKTSTKFFVNGLAKTKKIKLDSGVELESTFNHKYKVFRSGELCWVRADEIVVGDVVPYVVGGYDCINEIALKDLGNCHFNSKWKTSPKVLNLDLCWFLGLYVGDGSNHKKGIRIHGNADEPDDLIRASKILKDQFGICAILEYKRTRNLTLNVNSVDLLKWLDINGLKKSKSAFIEMPLKIRQARKELILSYIDGYWCADGGLHPINKTRSWVTTSRAMAEQMVVVLRAVGQDCSVRKMPPTKTSKGKRMRYWIQERKGRSGQIQKSPNRSLYEQLDVAGLHYLTPDFVISIDDSECNTFDIEVPNGNDYCANSYVSHNTTSCLLGTSSGIHPHHSKRYFRRIQGNMLESPLAYFTEINPDAVEQSVWSANKTDSVITFCVEVSDEAKLKKDFTAIELLEKVKLTQQNWVEAGTRKERCVQPWLRHNVSNTINVRPHEWDDVEEYIYANRECFAGISLLPSTGDLDYSQAPFCSISTPQEILEKYGDGSVFASGLIVDGLHAYNDLWRACDAVLGRFRPEDFPQEDWIRRAKQFAERYFNNDVHKMLYCLKELNNWKQWCDLNRVWKDVDYTQLLEDSDDTNPIQEVACSGGSCELR